MRQKPSMLITVGVFYCLDHGQLCRSCLNTALINASKLGRLDEIQSLVEKSGARLSCVDEQGLTPLHHACRHGRKDVVAYLVSKSK